MEANLNPRDWEFYVLALFGLTGLIQLIYYWLVFSRLAFYRSKPREGATEPVSVVICAKDEYHNLKKNLPYFLEQDYPDYEVVVVDDASDDDTAELLEDFAREYPRLKPVTIRQNLNFFRGKKFPLALGIKSAKHELILLSDADCRPAGTGWIGQMAASFSPEKEIVLGYGKYEHRRGFLDKLVRFETVMTALQYLSFALSRIPYMGVGRNLAYKKTLFFRAGGFISHYKISSGDDDLFINRVAGRRNTTVSLNPEAFTVSRAKTRFSDWWRQKKRHLTSSGFYKTKHKILLGAFSFSQFLFYLSFAFLLSINYNIVLALPLFA
ncbi:MAG: glycosyltransferase, partial [Bacteroidales bacterium]|nr:glycosyltransferase [Bacteroidales bacterium]